MNIEGEILQKPVAVSRPRILDFIELMKPELTGLSVLTALCGFYLASSTMEVLSFLWTAIGTICIGGGAGALNQYMERDFDALMKRTERRPLPSGRLLPQTVLVFGVLLSIVGIFVLTFAVNYLTGFLGFLTLVSYLFVYTPLKRTTPWSTLIGGIPGALPPMMGWTAASYELSLGAWILFAILFFWQMPHFFSLAWMYRKDYSRAEYKMLSVLDANGSRTSKHCLLHTAALIPASIALSLAGITGYLYIAAAIILGLAYLLYSVVFRRSVGHKDVGSNLSNTASRKLFFASLVYLPILMIIMVIDKI